MNGPESIQAAFNESSSLHLAQAQGLLITMVTFFKVTVSLIVGLTLAPDAHADSAGCTAMSATLFLQ